MVTALAEILALATLLRSGCALSTVTLTALAGVVLPAESRATAVRLWEPLATRVVFHKREYGAAGASAARVAPSSFNCTPTTPTVSVGLAGSVIVPANVAPAGGPGWETVRRGGAGGGRGVEG